MGGGITPGAMSMAGANTPYGQTPGFGRSAPYTPTANTPFMTPYATPGKLTQKYSSNLKLFLNSVIF